MTDKSVAPADFIVRFDGVRATVMRTKRAGEKKGAEVDDIGAWNAVNDPDLIPDAGSTLVLYGPAGAAEPTGAVGDSVELGAGPFVW